MQSGLSNALKMPGTIRASADVFGCSRARRPSRGARGTVDSRCLPNSIWGSRRARSLVGVVAHAPSGPSLAVAALLALVLLEVPELPGRPQAHLAQHQG